MGAYSKPKNMRIILLSLIWLGTWGLSIGQSADWTKVQDQNLVELRRSLNQSPTLSSLNRLSISSVWATHHATLNKPDNLATAPVPAAWNYQELAFFCKLEVKMEKALNLPVKVRLGEVQSVERMEGKLKTHFE
jgi:hypothetical protein